MEVPVDKLVSNNLFSNRTADDALVASIRRFGILVPLLAYEQDGALVLKDGHRRLDGAKKCGLAHVPVTLVPAPATDIEQVEINKVRRNVSYMDECRAIARLRDKGWRNKDIAEALGITEPEVSLRLNLANAHPSIQKAVEEGRVSPSAVEPVLSLSQAEQAELADAVISAKTVRKVRAVVDNYLTATALGEAQVVRSQQFDEDNPMIAVALTALEESARQIEVALQILEQEESPTLRHRARLTADKLMQLVQKLKQV